jgi:branched-chain amino acid transport system substrate-binding protein
MPISRRALLGAAGAAASVPVIRAKAQPLQHTIRIGVLTDLSGPFRDITGETSVICARQAVADFGVSGSAFDAEIITGDHRNDPKLGVDIARRWIEQDGVDVIADVPNSSVALAVSGLCREKDKILLDASATAVTLTGTQCSPTTIVWSFNTYLAAQSTGGAVVKAGGNTWYIIGPDYLFGRSLDEQTEKAVKRFGGEVLGRYLYPFPGTYDFSRYLQQAVASGAKVIGLANTGFEALNCVAQAAELGLHETGVRIAPLQMFITDVHALGLRLAGGLYVTETFYWDLNDRTRAFTARVRPRTPGNLPNSLQASAYSSVLHYLKTVAAMGVADAKKSGAATVARMKQTPTDDDAFGKGSIAPNGRGLFPAYLFQVKTPEESRGPWDVYKLVSTTPAQETVIPLDQTGCKISQR